MKNVLKWYSVFFSHFDWIIQNLITFNTIFKEFALQTANTIKLKTNIYNSNVKSESIFAESAISTLKLLIHE